MRVFSPRCSDSYAIVIVATCELHSAYPVFNLCLPNCFGVSAISKLSCLMFSYVSNLSLKFEINSKRSIIVPWQPLEPMPLPRPQQVLLLCMFTELCARFQLEDAVKEQIIATGVSTLSEFRHVVTQSSELEGAFITPIQANLANARLQLARLRNCWSGPCIIHAVAAG